MPVFGQESDFQNRDGVFGVHRLYSASVEDRIRESDTPDRYDQAFRGEHPEAMTVNRPGSSLANERVRTDAIHFASELSAGLLLQVSQTDSSIPPEVLRGSYPDVKKQTVPATKWLAALKGYSRPEDIADLEKDAWATAQEIWSNPDLRKSLSLSLKWIVEHYGQLSQAHPGVFALPVLISACYLPGRFSPEKPEWWASRSKFTDALRRLTLQYPSLRELT